MKGIHQKILEQCASIPFSKPLYYEGLAIMKRITLMRHQRDKTAEKESEEKIEEDRILERVKSKTRNNQDVFDAISIMCKAVKIDKEDLFSESRKSQIVLFRQCAMFIIYYYCPVGFNDLGAYFNRDHATALYSLKVVTKMKKGRYVNLLFKSTLFDMLKSLKDEGAIKSIQYYMDKDYTPYNQSRPSLKHENYIQIKR